MLNETHFNTANELKSELMNYFIYYNNDRPHMGINGEIPKIFNQNLSPN